MQLVDFAPSQFLHQRRQIDFTVFIGEQENFITEIAQYLFPLGINLCSDDQRASTFKHPRVRADLQTAIDDNTFWRSEEHTSELQSLMRISYAVFCLKKKKNHKTTHNQLNPT